MDFHFGNVQQLLADASDSAKTKRKTYAQVKLLYQEVSLGCWLHKQVKFPTLEVKATNLLDVTLITEVICHSNMS